MSPQHGWKGMVNAGVDVTPNSQVYVTVLGAYNKAHESFNYRSPISGTALDVNRVSHGLGANGAFNTIFLTPCPAATPSCPATTNGTPDFLINGSTFQFASIYPAGFTPRFVGVT